MQSGKYDEYICDNRLISLPWIFTSERQPADQLAAHLFLSSSSLGVIKIVFRQHGYGGRIADKACAGIPLTTAMQPYRAVPSGMHACWARAMGPQPGRETISPRLAYTTKSHDIHQGKTRLTMSLPAGRSIQHTHLYSLASASSGFYNCVAAVRQVTHLMQCMTKDFAFLKAY
jgi:hypothetical protein